MIEVFARRYTNINVESESRDQRGVRKMADPKHPRARSRDMSGEHIAKALASKHKDSIIHFFARPFTIRYSCKREHVSSGIPEASIQ